ncbi:hypothetical protein H9P43_009397 [Blastocladiella emersonii ATCC 22665]|nr:hypothetical protein H9P43_009397 [Blastocladiella emersonii ATCC 22665]
MEFNYYHALFIHAAGNFRKILSAAAERMLQGKRSDSTRLDLPTNVSAVASRGVEFNLRWMVKACADGSGAFAMHPFVDQLVRRAMNWHGGHGIVDIEPYLARLNERTARTAGAEAKVVTVHQVAPLIVVAIAVMASCGVALHFQADRTGMPPMELLYNGMLATFNDRHGTLGDRFAAESCALIDLLLRDAAAQGQEREE